MWLSETWTVKLLDYNIQQNSYMTLIGVHSTMHLMHLMHPNVTTIYNITDSSSTSTSKFLTRAELSIDGSEVTIRCEFTDEYPEASCILVYREYNDPYLTVEEYDRSTEFPVTISVDNTERYTFAVFGKNGVDGIDSEPVIKLKNESHVEYIPPPPPPPTTTTTTTPSSPSPSPSPPPPPSPSPCEISKSHYDNILRTGSGNIYSSIVNPSYKHPRNELQVHW